MSGTSWIGSLNVDSFVRQQLDRANARLDLTMQSSYDNLSAKKDALALKQRIYQKVEGMVSQLANNLNDLSLAFLPEWKVNYSDATAVSATVSGTAVPGSHTVEILQLAQAESISSKSEFSDTTSAGNYSDTLTLSVGSGAPMTVSIGATDSLQTIISSINNTAAANNAGITASAVNTGGGYHIVIGSTQTGEENKVHVSESGTSLLNISNDSSVNVGTVLTTAGNASFKFDDISVSSPGNNYTVNGINMNLLAKTSGPITLTLSETNPVSKVSDSVSTMLTTYNQLMTLIGQAEAQTAGSTRLYNMLTTLKNDMSGVFSGNGTLQKLADIGIQPELYNAADMQTTVTLANGTVTSVYLSGIMRAVETTSDSDGISLKDALSQNFAGIKSLLFDSQNGLFTALKNQLQSGTGMVWRELQGPDNGSLINTVQTEISSLQKKVDETDASVAKTKNNLKAVYADLEATLMNMQNTSFYVSQFLDAISSK